MEPRTEAAGGGEVGVPRHDGLTHHGTGLFWVQHGFSMEETYPLWGSPHFRKPPYFEEVMIFRMEKMVGMYMNTSAYPMFRDTP